MKDVAQLQNAMVEAGILSDYAVFGAMAQMCYTEAVATFDADILIAIPDPNRLDMLTPIYAFCAERGYQPEGDAIRVGAWPVQFIPAFDPLTMEALRHAEIGNMEGVPLRVVRADYLAAIALSTGRTKDFARVMALLESKATTGEEISRLCAAHDLSPVWERFKTRFLNV